MSYFFRDELDSLPLNPSTTVFNVLCVLLVLSPSLKIRLIIGSSLFDFFVNYLFELASRFLATNGGVHQCDGSKSYGNYTISLCCFL